MGSQEQLWNPSEASERMRLMAMYDRMKGLYLLGIGDRRANVEYQNDHTTYFQPSLEASTDILNPIERIVSFYTGSNGEMKVMQANVTTYYPGNEAVASHFSVNARGQANHMKLWCQTDNKLNVISVTKRFELGTSCFDELTQVMADIEKERMLASLQPKPGRIARALHWLGVIDSPDKRRVI
jgi:hypothetical protein